MNMEETIDISIAMRKLHRLQLEEGDLGAAYWLSISELLQRTSDYRNRAIAAERKLQKIRELLE
ncbi:hypothetical protein J2X56_003112 [Herbaspirillum sp. 1173]|uniref:hypothetical protein n=1 Tax=Herbaspirillum sp. 1173 TaxID=2817734 RepID=UPI0028614341|nr:hypothetical protein [Herbaspirillum sp. 1173]MDR6741088.1 hypothetical protein [Herbaspirillum sp. 1173]